MSINEIETYQSKIRVLVRKLANLCNLQRDEAMIVKIFDTLTRECLAYPTTERLPPFSWICEDSTPIQFSVSLSRNQQNNHTLRYVTEICKPTMDLLDRTNLTRKRLPLILEFLNMNHIEPQVNEALDLLFPSSVLRLDNSMFGIWVGVQHHELLGSFLKIYSNLLGHPDASWNRLLNVLAIFDREDIGKTILEMRNSFGACYQPSFIGIECKPQGFGRLKLYFRGYQVSLFDICNLLHELGFDSFDSELFNFHRLILNGRERYSPGSVVFCLSAQKRGEGHYGFKVEVSPRFYLENEKKSLIKLPF